MLIPAAAAPLCGILRKDYSTLAMRVAASSVELAGRLAFFAAKTSPVRPEKVKTLAILKFDRIGDLFLATPSLEALRKVFVHAKIVFFAAPWNREVLAGNPHLDDLRVLTRVPDVHRNSRAAFFRPEAVAHVSTALRNLAPDAAIDLQGNPLNVLAMFRARVPVRIGFDRKLFSFLLTCRIRHSSQEHQTDVYGAIPRALGWSERLPQPRLFVDQEIDRKVNDLIAKQHISPFFVLHLGAGHSYRRWPVLHFAQLADLVLASSDAIKIVVVGAAGDRCLSRAFLRLVSQPGRVADLTGQLEVRDLYALLQQADGFVGNDSAPAHLAAHAGVSTVVIMQSWPGIDRWKAVGSQVRIIHRDRHRCPGPHCRLNPCPNMAAISPDEVFGLLGETLQQLGGRL